MDYLNKQDLIVRMRNKSVGCRQFVLCNFDGIIFGQHDSQYKAVKEMNFLNMKANKEIVIYVRYWDRIIDKYDV